LVSGRTATLQCFDPIEDNTVTSLCLQSTVANKATLHTSYALKYFSDFCILPKKFLVKCSSTFYYHH